MLTRQNQLQLKLAFIYILLFKIVYSHLKDNYCDNDDVHALILARGGSKGIKMKNLVRFNGVTLLGRSIRTIQRSRRFQSIWVSTDNDDIAKEALEYGALVHVRSEQFARDNSTSIESVREFLLVHRTIHKFALFQCTSIFLKERYIREASMLFETHACDCVFAVTRNYKLRWQRLADRMIVPLNFNPKKRPRRQDWNGELAETGMFYFSTRNLVLQQNRFQNDRCSVVEIDVSDALEIDEQNDITLAKCLIAIKIKN